MSSDMDSSTIRVETITLPSARLGPTRDLVPVRRRAGFQEVDAEADIDEEMRYRMAYGRPRNIAPYLPQCDYDRVLTPQAHRVVVLENHVLRAEIMVDLGGRLRSLVDKRTGRELLYANAVFQPANLALRNAWFSGGVEWNIGTIGHGPFTASPMHAMVTDRPDGAASLRLYEYERLRGVVFSIEFVLSADAEHLIVRNEINNVSGETGPVPMYWWSNIAVQESDHTRVIVPARSAWKFDYTGGVKKLPVAPEGAEGSADDVSYPSGAIEAADYFFDVDDKEHPWVAAVGDDGDGLIQVSTAPLRGRKLFVWGRGGGGNHWQSWLSHDTGRYLEIQAGLAPTQREHVPMPAGATWSWVEAYGPVHVDRARAHGPWADATNAVRDALQRSGIREHVDRESCRRRDEDRNGPVIARGSGWGALEEARRRAVGEEPIGSPLTPFTADQLGPEQKFWLSLLDGTAAPETAVVKAAGYQRDPRWLEYLSRCGTAAAFLHSAVIRSAQGEIAAALSDVERSLALGATWQAHRVRALLLLESGQEKAAIADLERALDGTRDPIVVAELAEVLLELGEARRVLSWIDRVDAKTGRVAFLWASASLAVGNHRDARAQLEAGLEVADLAEGNDALGVLWRAVSCARLQEQHPEFDADEIARLSEQEDPLPPRYQFRMQAECEPAPH